jgi:amino acid transporter
MSKNSSAEQAPLPTSLRRTLSLPVITLYGLGTILGAGIYVLIGEVARVAQTFAPFAFAIAALIAGFTAFAYAELAARIPRSAGEAVYVQAAFDRDWLAACTGWAVVAVGIVSAATIAKGFTGYAQLYTQLPASTIVAILVVLLGSLAAWGVRETAWTAVVVTVVEVLGLLLVIAAGGWQIPQADVDWSALLPPLTSVPWAGIVAGAFLAFYAFIGFEDMVNMAEEVREPRRNLPFAILLALVISTLLYMLVAVVCVAIVPVDTLANSDAPLAAVVESAGLSAHLSIGPIGMVAVVNGALIQIVMATRVLYGMGGNGLAAKWLATVHPYTRTPLLATFCVTGVVLMLALTFPLVRLAQAASFVTLIIFTAVNLALLRLKWREPYVAGIVSYPRWVPGTGAILCVSLLLLQLSELL